MKTFPVGAFGKVSVWTDDLPASFAGATSRKHDVPGQAESSCRDRVAIELVSPRGAYTMYGLLGGTWQPSSANQLRIEIPCTDADAETATPYHSELVPAGDETFVGLPEEYADAVLAGVEEALAGGAPVGPGMLAFGHAAHGIVGSNPATFQRLGCMVTRLLATSGEIDGHLITSILDGA